MLAAGLDARIALAQGARENPAEAAFREGRALMQTGDLERACAKLAESQNLEPAAGTLLNLAECQEKRGLSASAWATYQEAAKASSARGRADWEKLAKSKVESLARIMPRVTYTAEGGTTVTQDGVSVRLDEPLPIDPGTHAVEGTRPSSKAPFNKTFEIRNGDKLTIAIKFDDAGPAPVPTPQPTIPPKKEEESDGSGMRTIGLIVAGVGIAGLGVGTVTGIMAMGKHDDAVASCPSYPDRCPADGSGTRLNEEARDLASISTIAFIGGGALVVVGAVLFFVAPSGKSPVTVTASGLGARF
jgi:hypothetical protein